MRRSAPKAAATEEFPIVAEVDLDRLHCFGESGNAYKVALMLTLSDLPWEPVFVDFFKGATRTDAFRSDLNPFGEAPVLERGGELLTQSGVILDRLARETGRFRPATEAAREECWRWILFDNHKFTAHLAAMRFLRSFAPKPPDPAVIAFLEGRARAAYCIAERRLAASAFLLGDEPTIADLSLAGYVYYPEAETGLNVAADFPAIDAWRGRIAELPKWQGPYDLMPRAFPGRTAG